MRAVPWDESDDQPNNWEVTTDSRGRFAPGRIEVWPDGATTTLPKIGKKILGRDGDRRRLDYKVSDGDYVDEIKIPASK